LNLEANKQPELSRLRQGYGTVGVPKFAAFGIGRSALGVRRSSLLLAISLALVPSLRAMSTTPDGGGYLLPNVASSIDGLECITVDVPTEKPIVVADKSAGWPDNSDFGPSVSVDRAALPKRFNKKPVHFTESRFEIVIIQELAADPVLLFPIHCFYSVHEHIRERAPPRLA
jgi:hypothetical protein